MGRICLWCVCFFWVCFSSNGQTPLLLNGTVIGTQETFDYSINQCSTTANTASLVFDNNLSTFFATCNRSGGWVGLDFGEPCVITEVAYCPRTGFGNRMVLGVFEGANLPDFGDAVPLFTVTQSPPDNQMTMKTVAGSKAFRYVRYIGPYDVKCNVAEVKFYGHKNGGTNAQLPQTTNIPTVSIHTTNAQDVVDRVTYIKGIITIVSDNGKSVFTDSLEIRGRGNFSWNFPKKPYRIKLYNKASLLGMPSTSKNWTLINNYGDKTLMRNLLAFDLSQRFEIPYSPSGKPVDLYLNGQYKGTYQLCDQIEVAPTRVAVDKMKPADVALPNLSGGYLIEMDAYANTEAVWFTSQSKGIPVTVKSPDDDEIVAVQTQYITTHFNNMEKAVFAANYTDPVNGYKKYVDIETMIRHFLVGEISGNTDTYWSTNMYKKRNDDKFYFGPVWDFDIAFENDYRTYPINNLGNWVYATNGSYANGVRDLVNRIYSDPAFLARLKQVYAWYRNSGAISEKALLGVVDMYADEIRLSQELNFKRWDILNTAVHMNPRVAGSYQGEVDYVKAYLAARIKWIDTKLNYIPTEITQTPVSAVVYWSQNQVLYFKGIGNNATISIYDVSGKLLKVVEAHQKAAIPLDRGLYFAKVKGDLFVEQSFKCIVR